MPKIDSIKKTLVLGSGPIIIGQAAERNISEKGVGGTCEP